MLDLSGMSSGKLSLVSGSTVAVTGGGVLRVQANIFASAPTITLSNNSELQFAENGGDTFGGIVSGIGTAWLIGGVLEDHRRRFARCQRRNGSPGRLHA